MIHHDSTMTQFVDLCKPTIHLPNFCLHGESWLILSHLKYNFQFFFYDLQNCSTPIWRMSTFIDNCQPINHSLPCLALSMMDFRVFSLHSWYTINMAVFCLRIIHLPTPHTHMVTLEDFPDFCSPNTLAHPPPTYDTLCWLLHGLRGRPWLVDVTGREVLKNGQVTSGGRQSENWAWI